MEHVCFFRGTGICEAFGNRPGDGTAPAESGPRGPDGGSAEGLATMLPRDQRRLVLLSGIHQDYYVAASAGRDLQGDGGPGQGWQRQTR